MNNRRALFAFLIVLALFLVGTVIVLSSVTYFFAIDPAAYIRERDTLQNYTSTNSSLERIPRIIHQTWKTDTLPPRWRDISQGCRAMMPDLCVHDVNVSFLSLTLFLASTYSGRTMALANLLQNIIHGFSRHLTTTVIPFNVQMPSATSSSTTMVVFTWIWTLAVGVLLYRFLCTP